VETRGWKQKHRLTRPLTSAYVYHCGQCGQRELAHPAPSVAIELFQHPRETNIRVRVYESLHTLGIKMVEN